MKPVLQTIVDKDIGDCHRALVASILELDIIQVPNFAMFKNWFNIYYYFMYANGWNYMGCLNPSTKKRGLLEEDSINGYFVAFVPSRTFEERMHAVIINLNGIVVHDPNPNQLWQDVNVLESGDLTGWYIFDKVEKVKK